MTDKVKVPQYLAWQLVATTDYADTLLYLYSTYKELKRVKCKTSEEKKDLVEKKEAVLRILRRVLTDHAKQLRERIRALNTFCRIKAILKKHDITYFEQTGPVFEELAALCEDIDLETLHRRLQSLLQLKLLTINDGKIHPLSWNALLVRFKVPLRTWQPYYHIRWDQDLSAVIESKLMLEKERLCEQAALIKLDNTPELLYELSRISGKKSPTLSTLLDIQLQLFKNPELIKAMDLDAWLIMNAVRPEKTLGYKFWSILLGYKSIGGLAYRKRKHEAMGLIAILKNKEEIDTRLCRTRRSRSNSLGTSIYNPTTNSLLFHRPDTIIYLPHNSPEPGPALMKKETGQQWGPYVRKLNN